MYGGNSMHLLVNMPSRPPLGEDSYDPHEEEAWSDNSDGQFCIIEALSSYQKSVPNR